MTEALIVILVVLPAISTVASIVLVRAARQRPPIRALTERAIVAVVATLAGWIIAVLAANSLVRVLPLERPWTTVLVILALLLFTAPGPVFLLLYHLGLLLLYHLGLLRDDQ